MKKMKIVTAAVGILCTVMVCTLAMGRLFIRASEIEEGENDVEALEPYITEEQENSRKKLSYRRIYIIRG